MRSPVLNPFVHFEAEWLPGVLVLLAVAAACSGGTDPEGNAPSGAREPTRNTDSGPRASSSRGDGGLFAARDGAARGAPDAADGAGPSLVEDPSGAYVWRLPQGFPMPDVPQDNPMSAEKVELGRHLFYDTRLSGNGTQACASCHEQELAFADGRATSVGSTGEVGKRNSPSLVNAAYVSTLTWVNPHLETLEEQIPIPIFGDLPIELGIAGHEDDVLDRFRSASRYDDLFAEAFPDSDDPYTMPHIVKALASFVRTIISGSSPYDRYVYGGEEDALSESAKRGMNLFFSEELECHHCHNGFNLTNATWSAKSAFRELAYFNTGLYNVGESGHYPTEDTGLFEFSGSSEDDGKFRTPSLRNVAVTAPYFHDGSAETLREVLEIYRAGGRRIEDGPAAGDGRSNPNKSGFLHGFELSDSELNDVLAFLESLTDAEVMNDPRFANPFE